MSLSCWLLGHKHESRMVPGKLRPIDLAYVERTASGWRHVNKEELVPQIDLLQFCPRCLRKYSGETGVIMDHRLSPEEIKKLEAA